MKKLDWKIEANITIIMERLKMWFKIICLQLFALVAMDAPKKLIGNDIRDSKTIILKNIVPMDGIFGQYNGYIMTNRVLNLIQK